MREAHDELDAIESGLIALHKAAFQHQAWEDIQRRAGIDMDRASATLLKVVSKCDKPCRMQTIAEQLGIEAPSVTRTAQQLEAAGLLARTPDPEDGRASNLSVTSAGKSELAKLHKARRERLASATQTWTKQERAQLGSLLQRLADGIQNELT